MYRTLLGVLLVLVTGCTVPPVSTPSGTTSPHDTPTPASSDAPNGVLVQFQPRHHFLYFVMDQQQLIFSGGAEGENSSPDIYSANPRTGTEKLVVSATDPMMTVTTLSSVNGTLIFVEAASAGSVIYRVRAHREHLDVVLDELVVDDPSTQEEARARVALPMVTTDGTNVAWTSGMLRNGTSVYRLMASDLVAAPRVLYTSSEWLGYPRLNTDHVYFTRGFSGPELWTAGLRATPPLRLSQDRSQAYPFADRVVTKVGGSGALAPGGVALWDEKGAESTIVPESARVSEPSMNERYVTWWGPTSRVDGYDWRRGRLVVLGQPLRDNAGKVGIVGRQAAYPGVIVWLATVPGDLHDTANIKPFFEVLYLD